MQLTQRFAQALPYAFDLHQGQVRKETEIPYISHLLAVAAIVLESGGDEDEAIAALLHDGPEDSGGEATLADIRTRFGDRVANIVADCSDTFEEPKPEWGERKKRHLAHLADAPRATRLVAGADKLHNLRSIVHDRRTEGDDIFDRFRGKKEGTLWYYRAFLPMVADLPFADAFAENLALLEAPAGIHRRP